MVIADETQFSFYLFITIMLTQVSAVVGVAILIYSHIIIFRHKTAIKMKQEFIILSSKDEIKFNYNSRQVKNEKLFLINLWENKKFLKCHDDKNNELVFIKISLITRNFI